LLNASSDEVEALDESLDIQPSELSSETMISDWKVTFESEALGSSELVVSQDHSFAKTRKMGTDFWFLHGDRGGRCNHPSVHHQSTPRRMHRWHDRYSGGNFSQRGGFSLNPDGVERDGSWGESLENEGAQEDNHNPLRAGFLGLSHYW